MGLFSKKKKETAPESEETTVVEKPVASADFKTGRMAGVYLKMYLWVFSVSLNYNSYQLESGKGCFTDEEFPLRGYYKNLLASLSNHILPDQIKEFEELFSVEALSALFSEGRTSVSGMFYARLREEADERDAAWYEFRAERIPTKDEKQLQFIFYIRFAAGEMDNGRLPQMEKPPEPDEIEQYNWDEVRAKRLLNNDRVIYYEYDVQNDVMHVHRLRDDKKISRVQNDYLATLNARSDWMVFHESVKDVVQTLKNASDGIAGEVEIRYRKDGLNGAEFIHYLMECQPLENRGKPTWLFGTLRDIEERVRIRQQNSEVMLQMDALLETFYTSMFQIDMNRGEIFKIVRKEGGFQTERDPQKLETKLRSQIQRGVIAEESAKDYLNWLQHGFLQHKTQSGSYEFEAKLRLPGDKDYRWYLETITAVKSRPGFFMRMRRDITETRQVRRMKYAMEEQARFSEYNRSVLDTIAGLVEFRNTENGEHIYHVRELTKILLTDLAARYPQYHITQKMVDLYTEAATIHDIGKITIPDSILNKGGKLTPEEFDVMKTHTTIGAQIIDSMRMPGLSDLKESCRDVALHHHERYDGKGYPEGLVGEEINIGVQAVSIADTYDALVSERAYKHAVPFDKAFEMILNGECGAFNADVLNSLKAVEWQLRKCYQELPQEEETGETVVNGTNEH